MAEPGSITIEQDKFIKVEFTDNCNLKLTDTSTDTYIFINLTNDEFAEGANKFVSHLKKIGAFNG